MHLAVVSSVLAAASVLARPHGSRVVQGGLAQDLRTSAKRSPILNAKEGRHRTRCRITPTPSSLNNSTISTSSDSSTSFPEGTGTPPPPPPAPPIGDGSSPWRLVHSHEGQSFFDKWDFWAYPDPTHGIVDYQNRDGAFGNGLAEINGAGNAIMRVETTPWVSGNRKSIRLHDSFRFNGGTMVILDTVHMPRGCGTWPAFWSNGPNWPYGGEIDILEGVHDGTINQASIHTGSGCHIPGDTSRFASSTLHGGTNCASYESNNSGCGFQETNPNSYGGPFNDVGGGVYVMTWLDEGISVHFFTRSAIPADIESGNPRPETWHNPSAFWPRDRCDPNQFFTDHHTIFDTTLCGDWAGSPGAWQGSGCAARTGFGSCEEYVRANGQDFGDAYWEVRYVRIFQL